MYWLGSLCELFIAYKVHNRLNSRQKYNYLAINNYLNINGLVTIFNL